MSDPERPYSHPRITELAALIANWDFYDAEAPDPRALRYADSLSFCPTPDGGLNIALDYAGGDVSIVLSPDGRLEEFYVVRNDANGSKDATDD